MSTLALLTSFHAVCQTLNISSAAARLGISQPALSRQLKRLEEDLGTPLFVRRQRGIALTDDGTRLAEAVAPALSTLDQRLNLLKSRVSATKTTLKVGSLTEIGKTMVVPVLMRLAREFPDLACELRFQKGAEILQGLAAGELDLGVMVTAPGVEALRGQKVADERSLVVTRQLNHKRLATAGDVLAAEFVAYRAEDPLFDAFVQRHFPGISRRKLNPRFVVNDHKSMVDLLLAFDAFAVMPAHSVAGYLQTGMLVKGADQEISSPIYVVRPQKSRDDTVTRRFVELIADGSGVGLS